MVEAIIWIIIGAFIGWHFPEPQWIKTAKTKLISKFKKES